ncbi:uncharacterized protein TNIN_485581 [Trichonephila inaurata madagascariensis]|uniref:Gustatory receptor n=1 Tax=Trichonephila inaurata madagascariensis TaxID=2747483 RepID=A0A8X6MLP8_9ARAC|nr:uncharacterized protein TNIN_485581 [Trichonephila inaurata madagascariensis]
MIEATFISEEFKRFLLVTSDIAVVTNAILLTLITVSLSAFYGLTCFYIKILCYHTKLLVRNVREISECKPIIYKYLKIRNIMESLEHFMCFSAFILIVNGMTGIFWLSYSVIFLTIDGYRHYMSCMAAEVFHCFIIGMVIISASDANTAADVAKEAVMSLPGKIPQYYTELKAILRKDCKQNVNLTLWKMYKIDRSLIICALGVLMNYGILIATLGTVSTRSDK